MTYTQDELQVLFSKVRGTRKRLSIPKAANTTLKLLSDLLTRCYEEKWDPDLSCVIDKASEEERN